jgi:hypothetical protein
LEVPTYPNSLDSPVLLIWLGAAGAFAHWGGVIAQVFAANTIVFLVAIVERLAVRSSPVEKLALKLAFRLETRVGSAALGVRAMRGARDRGGARARSA